MPIRNLHSIQRFLRLLFVMMITVSAAAQPVQSQAVPAGGAAGPLELSVTGNPGNIPQDDPCNQAKPGLERINLFSKTTSFQTALLAIQEKVRVEPFHEHTIAFGSDAGGNFIITEVSTGGRSSSRIPFVSNAFADLHNHPKNTPPSSGDLYGLINKNKKEKHYSTRYVATPDGSMYALLVTDTAAARMFTANFPPQQMPGYSPLFPDDLLNEFREIKYQHGAAEELAMAYVLEKYKAGVVLLKQDSTGDGGFKKINVSVKSVGSSLVFTAADCP
jgi:hypothetical protein